MNGFQCNAAAVARGAQTAGTFGALGDWLRRLRVGVARLRERQRQRAALARLDARLLRDIGLTAQQARAEVRKPIWRD
jgi:uncharacterized protein YjiS (DUF1127 family)